MNNLSHRVHTAGFAIFSLAVIGVFSVIPYIARHQASVLSIKHEGVVQGEQVVAPKDPLVLFPSLKKKQAFTVLNQASINATSAFVMDTKTYDVYFEKNSEIEHTIASLTKLITTGMLFERGFQESEASVSGATVWNAIDQFGIPLSKDESVSRLKLPFQESFSSHDLLQASLVGSANDATFALVASQGLDESTFRNEMNAFLSRHHATHTKIFEPSGLDWRNVSTAREFAELARIALSFVDVRTITGQVEATIIALGTNNVYHVSTTNDLLELTDYIIGGKTGFLDASGYTFTLLTRHTSGREIVIVLLGSSSKSARIDDARTIMNWLNANYTSN